MKADFKVSKIEKRGEKMRKLPSGLLLIEMVITPDEKRKVRTMILASGKTESSWLREMCGLDPLRRGAPIGNKNRKGKKKRRKKPMFATLYND